MKIQTVDNKTSFGKCIILDGTFYHLPKKEQQNVKKVICIELRSKLRTKTKGLKLVIGADLKPKNPDTVNITMKKEGNIFSIPIPAKSFNKFVENDKFFQFLSKNINSFKEMIKSEQKKGVKAFNITLAFDETMV